jgi:hypothetical protein
LVPSGSVVIQKSNVQPEIEAAWTLENVLFLTVGNEGVSPNSKVRPNAKSANRVKLFIKFLRLFKKISLPLNYKIMS